MKKSHQQWDSNPQSLPQEGSALSIRPYRLRYLSMRNYSYLNPMSKDITNSLKQQSYLQLFHYIFDVKPRIYCDWFRYLPKFVNNLFGSKLFIASVFNVCKKYFSICLFVHVIYNNEASSFYIIILRKIALTKIHILQFS